MKIFSIPLLKELVPKELQALWLKDKCDGEEFLHFSQESFKSYKELSIQLWRLIIEINNNFQTSNHDLRKPFKNSVKVIIDRYKAQTSLAIKEITSESNNYVTAKEVREKLAESFQKDKKTSKLNKTNQSIGRYCETDKGSFRVLELMLVAEL